MCFYSDTNVTAPATTTCPFIPPYQRLDCGKSDQNTCLAAGCCWHSALSTAIGGPSCYRSDVFYQLESFTGYVTNYVAPADRVTTLDATQQDCEQNEYNSAFYFLPLPGQGFNNSCFLASYSNSLLGYSYRNSNGNYTVCDFAASSQLKTVSRPMLSNTSSPDVCLQMGGCWWNDTGCGIPMSTSNSLSKPYTASSNANYALNLSMSAFTISDIRGNQLIHNGASFGFSNTGGIPFIFQFDFKTAALAGWNSTALKIVGSGGQYLVGTDCDTIGWSCGKGFADVIWMNNYDLEFSDISTYNWVFYPVPGGTSGQYYLYSMSTDLDGPGYVNIGGK